MEQKYDFKHMTAEEYIYFFIEAILKLTEVSISFDMSYYETIEEGFKANKKISLEFALKQYGIYSINNDGYTNNGDVLQIGLKRFFSDLDQLVSEGSLTNNQKKDIKNEVFDILLGVLEIPCQSDKILSRTDNERRNRI